ncbi:MULTISPECIES: ATP-grasp domain-containing protein [unclassified Bradyrhizobium]|uniref:ATP-grasp domain-containing protein n=1 Tax=unclassified Bradyrhizobium TaxID=2631580 RepID=UPI00291620B1|nr:MULTISPECIES: ATP-grasp domain-containing protein [unclassified Bradyrhizobium]
MRLLLVLGQRPLTPYALRSLRDTCEVFALGPDSSLAPLDANHAKAVPAFDQDTLERHALQFGVGFDAVGTLAESRVVVTAQLAERLGRPHLPVDAARRCSVDKIAMRRRLAAAGVPGPDFYPLSHLDPDTLTAALHRLGPMVVKPCVGEFSQGVRKIDAIDAINVGQMRADVERSRQLGYFIEGSRWLAESYVAGAMASVEGFVVDGRIEIMGLVENEMGPEPHFVMTGNWLPPRFSPAAIGSCQDIAIAAVAALGLDNCFFHCELRLSKHGPSIIEVAARLPGGLIPEAYERAYGFNLYALQTRIWSGTNPTVERSTRLRILQRGRFAAPGDAIVSVSGFDRAVSMPGVWQFGGLATPGQQTSGSSQAPVPLYYYGVEGLWPEDLEALAERIEACIHIEVRGDGFHAAC